MQPYELWQHLRRTGRWLRPLLAHSGLFELARLTSAIGGKADTPERVYEYTT